ncbi:HK97 family phage prohead protease [Streptomyces monticola]|uniref:HK97 family phage prohead protease n=1 Tax=Streptomyces monticola TaxID=2666263 RepID=A0ABW2JQP9_9ACTN
MSALDEGHDVRALFNHDPSKVLGRTASGTLRLEEDDIGLRYTVDLPNTSYADDLLASIRRGDISHSSFGFKATDAKMHPPQRPGEPHRRELREVRLFDVSPVTYPAYEESTVSLRSLLQNNGLEDPSGPGRPGRAGEVRSLREAFETRGANSLTLPAATDLLSELLHAGGNGARIFGRVIPVVPAQRSGGAGPVAGRVAWAGPVPVEIVKEGEPWNPVTVPIGDHKFGTIKTGAYVQFSSEVLEDAEHLLDAIDHAFWAGLGLKLDSLVLSGGTDGAKSMVGLLDRGTKVDAVPDLKALSAAVAAVEEADGTATHIVTTPAVKAGLVASLTGNQLEHLPPLVSSRMVPTGTALVLDSERCRATLAEEIQVVATERALSANADIIDAKIRCRVGGVAVAGATDTALSKFVQIIKKGP